ncbi:nicotinate (nicotinamide) nucleotide adenylyltransferase [Candidatus Protochlamydia phocaeensis]|uniref:nicotinate (nicotinamide) nucleotide adenylyltransferase n=1 Tax=Candidatus Protochlamydia phocaeensis TaxID=1414722 RepID=UPI0008388226|nr:nicotinate (nicotinamide) nucleotide adenylyltransferase [Candidatus Protochlamydia phocaeensis]
MLKKIGLLGGSFDPVHVGHLNLAFELMEKKQLDEVWFIPAQLNPHKSHAPPTSIDHRLKMVHLAIKDIPQFILKDLEAKRPPPSYTIDTLQAFIAEEAFKPQPNQFFLLMGEDMLPNFYRWHMPEEIVKLVPLLIGSRSGIWQTDAFQDFNLAIREAILKGLIQTRLMDISGTELRQRLAQRHYCGHLIPYPVLQYIQEHHLYVE